MPKVSVMIPVFNAAPFLGKCIESVISQSLSDIEIICVDDKSTDASLSILKKFRESDERIAIIENSENRHAGPSRNEGLAKAKGEYVMFLDADDWLNEGALEQAYRIAKKSDAEVLRCCAFDFDSESALLTKDKFNFLQNVPFFLFNKAINFKLAPYIFSRVNVSPWGGIYKRKFLSENNFYFDDLVCCNDRSFFCRIILAAKRIVFSKIVLLYYRVHNSESLVGKRMQNIDCMFQSYCIVYEETKKLSPFLRRMYLRGEMFDLAYWLEKSAQTEYAGDVKLKVQNFLSNMDKSIWARGIENEKWFKKITRI